MLGSTAEAITKTDKLPETETNAKRSGPFVPNIALVNLLQERPEVGPSPRKGDIFWWSKTFGKDHFKWYFISMSILAISLFGLQLGGTCCQIIWLHLGDDGYYHSRVAVYLDYQAMWMQTVFLSDLNVCIL